MSVPLLSANSSGSGFMEGFLRSTMISEGSHCKSKSHPSVMKAVSGHAQDSAWRNLVLMRELGSLSTLALGPLFGLNKVIWVIPHKHARSKPTDVCKGETMVLCSACLPVTVILTSHSCTELGPHSQMAWCQYFN